MALPPPSLSITSSSNSSPFLLHQNRIPINTTLSFDYSSSTKSINSPTVLFSINTRTRTRTRTHTHQLPHSLQFRTSSIAAASSAWENDEYEEEEEIESLEEEEEEEEYEETSQANGEAEGSSRLYVGNLPYSMTSSELADLFAESGGRVSSVEIVYDRVTDRSRGFAFITMGSVEEANVAIRMFDGSQVGGRTVKVNFPEVPRGGEREVMGSRIRSSYRGFVDSPYKLYAGNLAWTLTSQGLQDAFADHPGLLSAKVLYDRDSGRSKGFGFISFASAQEMQSALRTMNGVEVEGRPLRLNLAQRANIASNEPLETKLENETTIDDGAMQSAISAF